MVITLYFILSVLAVIGTFLITRLLAHFLTKIGDSKSTIEQWFFTIKPPLVVCHLILTYVLFHGLDVGAIVSESAGDIDTLVISVQAFTMTLVAMGGVYTINRGLSPVVATLKHSDFQLPATFRHRNRIFVALCIGVLYVSMSLIRADIIVTDSRWLLVVVIILAAGVYLPFVTPRPGGQVRYPTDSERERIEQCYQRLGRKPPFLIITNSDRLKGGVVVRGFGTFTSCIIKSNFLNDATDDELAITIGQAEQRNRLGYWIIHYWAVIPLALTLIWGIYLVYVLLISGFSLRIPVHNYLGLLIIIPGLILNHIARKTVYQSDEWVATKFDNEFIRSTYRTNAADIRLIPEFDSSISGKIDRYLVSEPVMENRIKMLSRDTHTSSGNGPASTTDEPVDESSD